MNRPQIKELIKDDLLAEKVKAPADLIPKNIVDCWILAEMMCHPHPIRRAVVHVTAKAWFRLADASGMPLETSAYLAGLEKFKIDPCISERGECEFTVHAMGTGDIVTIASVE